MMFEFLIMVELRFACTIEVNDDVLYINVNELIINNGIFILYGALNTENSHSKYLHCVY